MARSEYVYVLEIPGQPPVPWTVKRELRSWLTQNHPGTDVRDWRLWRCPDGRPGAAISTMNIEDLRAGR
jgi:hypothetical protein